ncbi:MAG: NAD(P)-dependent oxidoreductase [Chloroflexota bacterium]
MVISNVASMRLYIPDKRDMMTYTLLVTDPIHAIGITYLKSCDDIDLLIRPNAAIEEIKGLLPEVDAWIVDREQTIDIALLELAPSLKVIGRAGLRTRYIDIKAATERGILILNLPHGMAISMAEHTFGLMLAAARKIPQAFHDMTSGRLSPTQYQVHDLYEKRLGLIGFNQVARLLATRAQAFGMTVLVYEPALSEQIALDYKIELVDLEDLLPAADIISLHSDVLDGQEGMVDQVFLSRTKPGVILINTTSPRLIDADALADAVKSQQIGAVALDGSLGLSFSTDPTVGLQNAIHTPEMAILSAEGRERVSIEMAQNIVAALRGGEIRHPVNLAYPDGVPFAQVQAYTELARKIGSLQAQLAPAKAYKVEVEVSGDRLQDMVRPIGAGLLHGLLAGIEPDSEQRFNQINAPLIASEKGIQITQTYHLKPGGYSNLLTCRVHWYDSQGRDHSRLISGVLFDEKEPRIVQVDGYRLEAKPDEHVLVMRNKDVPGVIGQVATLLATYEVNIAEWRLGRLERGGEALSFINLDGVPPQAVIDALAQAPAVTSVDLVFL